MTEKKTKKQEIGDDQPVRRKLDKFLFTRVDEESVLMNMDNGRYLGLSEVSTDIWEQINPQSTLRETVKYLLTIYEVDEQQCYDDTKNFFEAMLGIGLIEIVDE